LMQKDRLRLSKYYVPYTIHEAENVNTYQYSEYVFINTGQVLGIERWKRKLNSPYHFKNTVMENT